MDEARSERSIDAQITLAEALIRVTHRLATFGPSARDEALWLTANCLGISRTILLTDPQRRIDTDALARLDAWSVRRANGEPLAYLTGEREFWSLPLQVSPAVLVPRPETERLVELALEHGDALRCDGALRVLDLGTGSGAVAIAIAHERSQWRVTAVDRSPAALAVARANAALLALTQLEFLQGDWYSPFSADHPRRRFEIIVSNPPYVAADDPLMHGDSLRHEPYAALTPGTDALAALRAIIAAAPDHLVPNGWLLLEHGHAQGAAVREMLVSRGFAHVVSHPDLAGHERTTQGRLPAAHITSPEKS